MKYGRLIINILAVLGLAACQVSKETVIEKHYVNDTGPGLPVPQSQNHGGADPGGGGNGVGGKPLESFRFELSKLGSFQRLKSNILNKLVARFPRLAADILHVAEERSWYLIPTELDNLPMSKIGVNFKTEQIALQKLKEVWINELLFSKMDAHDQDTLILHELVMGVRLLEFNNLLDKCLVSIAPQKLVPGAEEKYNEARKLCFKKYRHASDIGASIGLGKEIRLEDYDYETIREITSLLMTRADDFNPQEMEDYMAARKFRSYNP